MPSWENFEEQSVQLPFGSRELRKIEKVVVVNREEVLEAWNEYLGG